MIDRCFRSWTMSRRRLWPVLALAAWLLAALPAAAQDQAGQQEVGAARERIQALLRQAEELEQSGREEAAKEARQKARQLNARLRQAGSRGERGQPRQADELREILEGLEHGMVALERLGRRDELQALRRVADDVRKEMQRRDQPRRETSERQVVQRQIEVLRLAQKALAEAERRDAVEILQRAIRAREVGLEGRRDEEVQAIRKRAPGRGDIIELLVRAEAIYREFNMPDRADMISRATEELWAKRDRPRAEREGPRAERERAADRRPDRRDRAQAPRDQPRRPEAQRENPPRRRAAADAPRQGQAERLRQLQNRMRELERAIDELRREFEAMKRQRD